jgi:hypothetical protein
LRAQARNSSDIELQEKLRLLACDLASLPELELYVRQVRESIREFGLRAIVSANNIDSFLGASTVAAHSEGIPHICIHNTALERVALPAYADCDLYLAPSDSYARFMRSSGAIGRVEALGLPSYDSFVSRDASRNGGAVLRAYPHLAGRKLVGVTTQTAWIDFRPLLNALVDWAERRNDVGVVIKLHPRESPDAYADIVRRLESAGCGGCVHHVDLVDYLVDLQCLVAGASTTLFWAILNGVRPFSWQEPNIRLMAVGLEYLGPEVTDSSEDPGHLIQALSAALDDQGEWERWQARRQRFVVEHLTGADGNACKRILERIAELSHAPTERYDLVERC